MTNENTPLGFNHGQPLPPPDSIKKLLGNKRIGIVVAEWNAEITGKLLDGAVANLIENGVSPESVIVCKVPGTFELSLGSQWLAEKDSILGVIALGCVIQGETRHFDFICDAVANGITQVGLKTGKPVIFGVLTTNNHQQALERAGGKLGNKGTEAAVTLLKMLLQFKP